MGVVIIQSLRVFPGSLEQWHSQGVGCTPTHGNFFGKFFGGKEKNEGERKQEREEERREKRERGKEEEERKRKGEKKSLTFAFGSIVNLVTLMHIGFCPFLYFSLFFFLFRILGGTSPSLKR